MNNIETKPFNPDQKIAIPQFVGSPNLLTTSDVNNNVERIQYQLNQLYESAGVISDLVVTDNQTSITINYSYMECRGCKFMPPKPTIGAEQVGILYLIAKRKLVTFADNSIAGATFADGTRREAADYQIYTDEKLSFEIPTGYEVIGRVFERVKTAVGNPYAQTGEQFAVHNFCHSRESSIVLDKIAELSTELNNLQWRVKNAQSYGVSRATWESLSNVNLSLGTCQFKCFEGCGYFIFGGSEPLKLAGDAIYSSQGAPTVFSMPSDFSMRLRSQICATGYDIYNNVTIPPAVDATRMTYGNGFIWNWVNVLEFPILVKATKQGNVTYHQGIGAIKLRGYSPTSEIIQTMQLSFCIESVWLGDKVIVGPFKNNTDFLMQLLDASWTTSGDKTEISFQIPNRVSLIPFGGIWATNE